MAANKQFDQDFSVNIRYDHSLNSIANRPLDIDPYQRPRPEKTYSILEHYNSNGPDIGIDMKVGKDFYADLFLSHRNISQNDSDHTVPDVHHTPSNHSQYDHSDNDHSDSDPYLYSRNYSKPILEIYDLKSDLNKLADQFQLLSIGSNYPDFEIDQFSQKRTSTKLGGSCNADPNSDMDFAAFQSNQVGKSNELVESHHLVPNPDPNMSQLGYFNKFRSDPDLLRSQSIPQLDGNISPFNDPATDTSSSSEAIGSQDITDGTVVETEAALLKDSKKEGSMDSIVSTPIEIKDIHAMELKISHEKREHFEELKEKFITRTRILGCQSRQLDMFNSLSDTQPELEPLVEETKIDISNLRTEIQQLGTQLTKLSEPDIQDHFATPIYGENTKIPKNLFTILPVVTQNNNIKVKHLWQMLSDLVTPSRLTPSIIKTILLAKIGGTLTETFQIYKDLPDPRDIAIKLSTIYDTPTSTVEYLKELQSFHRFPNETVIMATSRLSSILFAIDQHRMCDERKLNDDIILRTELKKMVSKSIWTTALATETKALRDGLPFNIDSLIHECDLLENDCILEDIPLPTVLINNVEAEIDSDEVASDEVDSNADTEVECDDFEYSHQSFDNVYE